jgi:hypothetical protein
LMALDLADLEEGVLAKNCGFGWHYTTMRTHDEPPR